VFVLVVGGGKVGYYLAKELIESGHEVALMEKDRTRATQIGAAVLVFDARGEPLVQRAFRRSVTPETVATLQRELHERSRRRDARAFLPSYSEEDNRALALPVATDGRPGPGEIRIRCGRLAAISATVISSLRRTATSSPSSPKYWTRL